jgi:hypothetical protein
MLTEFDQSTIANMTAALDFVCKKIPTERDGTQLRKQIADEIIRCARSGRRTLGALQEAGLSVLEETAMSERKNWFGLGRYSGGSVRPHVDRPSAVFN